MPRSRASRPCRPRTGRRPSDPVLDLPHHGRPRHADAAASALWSLWARFRKTLYTGKWLQRAAVLMGPSGFVAVLAGWYTTEVGRQPYTVYGLLRTSDSLSNVDAEAIGASLIAFIIVYFVVFGAGVFYILRLVRHAARSRATPELQDGPTRTAGITPAQQLAAEGGADDPLTFPSSGPASSPSRCWPMSCSTASTSASASCSRSSRTSTTATS